jgi:glycosyltransferase involved in cell wall biosynthesis
MKLLVDLIACQTPSRMRGIGRYTLELTRALASLRGNNELICMADPLLVQPYEELRQDFIRRLPAGSFLPYFRQPIPENQTYEEKGYRQLASSLICQARQVVSPDIVLTPSVFEGWGFTQFVVPFPEDRRLSYKQAMVLYDFIPFIYHDRYLDANSTLRDWYLKRINSLKHFDLLLAISEATRQDAIRLLNLAPEKVVNISSAAGNQFQKIAITETEKNELMHRLGISRPFVFYLGGNDFRKNMEGAVKIFANLSPELIETYQLVLNDVGDETDFRGKVRSTGLSDQDVVIIKWISDDELLKLYNLCSAFIFPSLYEGFGLPILEAMACGAPVSAANNSSLPEVVGREDMLFDANDPKQAAASLARVLTDTAFRAELSQYGQERVRQFSWKNSALAAWQSMEDLQQKSLHNRLFSSVKAESNRPRIGFVSPLPPQQSGVSDYSAELLPYLADHFDIDLFVEPGLELKLDEGLRCFNMHPWTELLNRRDDYATVVYQFGNSPFHAHMFDLVRKFPGVIVLHDFFLSHVIAHLHAANGAFPQQLDKSHGLKSLVDYCGKGHDIVWDWPVNWQVLRQAKEIIVHSTFHEQLLDKYYYSGWQPRLNIVPHLRTAEPELTPDIRALARADLNIPAESFLFCSFGHMGTTKLNLQTVEAFQKAQQSIQRDCQLIFVGDCLDEVYRNQITRFLREHGITDKVHITGFVKKEEYRRYLQAADAAVQLRQNSRGETSGAVLDCMAFGLPVILNAHSTFNDYMDEEVVKITDPINLPELSQSMLRLEADEAFRREKGVLARNRIKSSHNPESVAEAYAAVIERAIEEDDRVLLKPAIDALASLNFPPGLLEAQANYAAQNQKVRSRPRILIDVTATHGHDHRTGIQRVVKRIVQELMMMPCPSPQIEPVYIADGKLKRASRFIEKILDLPSDSLGEEQQITIRPGDSLVMLDSTWGIYENFAPTFKEIRLFGGKIVTVIYDLIPINYPHFFSEDMSGIFSRWLTSACMESDTLLCISQAVAEEVSSYRFRNKIGLDHQLDITSFQLGADIPAVSNEFSVREEVTLLTQKINSALFLVVGTLEPRKGHAFTLDAFELMWSRGDQTVLVFAGKVDENKAGNIREVETRIRTHPMLNKLFFLIENPSDAELEILYSKATALIAASTAEGFGLPIVEAALHGVPALASDIPVFHEVGGDGALYFSLESPDNLAETVDRIASLSKEERLAMAKKINVLTWKESAEMFMGVINSSELIKNNMDSHLAPTIEIQ